ncbi:GerAB/ArcD/ProY family transporter [Pseudalkalibacillus decolorationis]|uniref:GerAB/ArcD/ProY family transporter n=1 Tax=Pseudalkalibacillus decolorationis TaxID=163879 RepID=UPI002148BC91|nr:spore germination protein [Pseudalkalibacillus decolorationis]
MKSFEYGDEEIGEIEIFFIVASFMIAVGVLTLPRLLAESTQFSDGWVSLVIAGIISISFIWVTAKLASRFPNQTFFTYASLICSKPVAAVFTIGIAIYFVALTAYETRVLAVITKQYLFDQTPLEVIALLFLLVVVYAVSGTRVGVIRLNILFLPIILVIAVLLMLLNIQYFEVKNLTPAFTTSWAGYWKGTTESFFSISGFAGLLFYMKFVNRPKKAPKYAMFGVCVPLGLYLLLYVMAIGVFNTETTATLVYPTVELAKEAEIPGGFLERFESLFLTIWIMAIFNTTSLAYDVSLMAFCSVFGKVKKTTFIFVLTPIIYLVAMFPEDVGEVELMAKFLNYPILIISIIIPVTLLLLAKLRGIKGNG